MRWKETIAPKPFLYNLLIHYCCSYWLEPLWTWFLYQQMRRVINKMYSLWNHLTKWTWQGLQLYWHHSSSAGYIRMRVRIFFFHGLLFKSKAWSSYEAFKCFLHLLKIDFLTQLTLQLEKWARLVRFSILILRQKACKMLIWSDFQTMKGLV